MPAGCETGDSTFIFFIAGLLYLLRFERVDNLGEYCIPSETGLLIPSVYDSNQLLHVRNPVYGPCGFTSEWAVTRQQSPRVPKINQYPPRPLIRGLFICKDYFSGKYRAASGATNRRVRHIVDQSYS